MTAIFSLFRSQGKGRPVSRAQRLKTTSFRDLEPLETRSLLSALTGTVDANQVGAEFPLPAAPAVAFVNRGFLLSTQPGSLSVEGYPLAERLGSDPTPNISLYTTQTQNQPNISDRIHAIIARIGQPYGIATATTDGTQGPGGPAGNVASYGFGMASNFATSTLTSAWSGMTEEGLGLNDLYSVAVTRDDQGHLTMGDPGGEQRGNLTALVAYLGGPTVSVRPSGPIWQGEFNNGNGPETISGRSWIPPWLLPPDSLADRLKSDTPPPPPPMRTGGPTLGLAGSLGLLEAPFMLGSSNFIDTQPLNPSWASTTESGSPIESAIGTEVTVLMASQANGGSLSGSPLQGRVGGLGLGNFENWAQADVSMLTVSMLESLLGDEPAASLPGVSEIRLVTELVPLDESSLALVASLFSVPHETTGAASAPGSSVSPPGPTLGTEPPSCAAFLIGLNEGFEQSRLSAREWDAHTNLGNEDESAADDLTDGPRAVSQAAFGEAIRQLEEERRRPEPDEDEPAVDDERPAPAVEPQENPEIPATIVVGLTVATSLLNSKTALNGLRRRRTPRVKLTPRSE